VSDPVNHPKHYNAGKFEVIDVIDDWKLGFALGNTVKYIARAAHKGSELEDLKKAAWYLNHRIEELSGSANDHYLCPFCKSLSFGKRANAEEVFCTCGATVKWSSKIDVDSTEREQLCKLTLKLMNMTDTTKLEDALRDLELAMRFVMRHEERNPTHLLLTKDEQGCVACGADSESLTSLTTVGRFDEVTCKDCRVAYFKFLRTGT